MKLPIIIRGSTGYPRAERPAPSSSPATSVSSQPVTPGEDCPHRGPQTGTIPNTGCGCNGGTLPIFSCVLHGECTPRKVNAGQTVQACWDCQIDGLDGGLAFPEGSGLARQEPPAAPHETVLAHGGFAK